MSEAGRPCGRRLGGDAPGWGLSVRPLNSTSNTDLETPASDTESQCYGEPGVCAGNEALVTLKPVAREAARL